MSDPLITLQGGNRCCFDVISVSYMRSISHGLSVLGIGVRFPFFFSIQPTIRWILESFSQGVQQPMREAKSI